MSDDDPKVLFRLIALEMLMMERLANEYLRTPDPAQTAAKHRDDLRDMFSQVAFPGFDAALSDYAIGEIGDAVDRIVERAQQMAVQRAGARKQP